jgi:hypothetical protein
MCSLSGWTVEKNLLERTALSILIEGGKRANPCYMKNVLVAARAIR